MSGDLSFLELEADTPGEQHDDELVEADALAGGLFDEPRVHVYHPTHQHNHCSDPLPSTSPGVSTPSGEPAITPRTRNK